MQKNIFFILLMIYFINNINAQNTLLIDEMRASVDKDFEQIFPADAAQTGDMNAIVSQTVASCYDYKKQQMLGNYPAEQAIENNFYSIQWQFVHQYRDLVAVLKSSFLKNQAVYELVYKAALPYFQDFVQRMTQKEANEYLAFVKKGLDYASDFNLKKEKAAFAKAEKSGLRFQHVIGRFQAFIYRRIANGELSQKDCIYWLSKFYNDLSSAVNKNAASDKDNYFLKEKLSPDFFLAYHSSTDENKQNIIQLKQGAYKLLLPADAQLLQYNIDGNSIAATAKMPDGSYFLHYFGEDGSELKTKLAHEPGYLNFTLSGNLIYVPLTKKAAEPVTKDLNLSLFLVKDGKLERLPIENVKQLYSLSEGFWGLSYTDKADEIICFNTAGVLEKNVVKNLSAILQNGVFLFKYANGNSILQTFKNLSGDNFFEEQNIDATPLAAPFETIYYGNGWAIWLLDKDNKLHLKQAKRVSENQQMLFSQELLLEAKLTDFKVLNNNHGLATYADGKQELLYIIQPEYPIHRVELPNNKQFSDFSDWRNPANRGLYFIASTQHGKKGILSGDGKTAVEPIYDDIRVENDLPFLFFGKKDATGKMQYALANQQFKLATEHQFQPFTWMEDFDVSETVYEAMYKDYSPQDKTFLLNQNGKMALYDISGKPIIPANWGAIHTINPLNNNSCSTQSNKAKAFYLVENQGKYAFFGLDGKQVGAFDQDKIGYLRTFEGLPLYFYSTDEENFALYNKKLERISPVLFSIETLVLVDSETLEECLVADAPLVLSSDKAFISKQNGKPILCDFSGKTLIPADFEVIQDLSMPTTHGGSFYAVSDGNKWAIFDNTGKRLTEFIYDKIGEFSAGFFNCERDGKVVRVDSKGIQLR